MAEDPKRTPAADRPANPGGDQDRDGDRDKTLTELEEEKAGGTNKKTPGPIYDV
jgi:hypothetical protein